MKINLRLNSRRKFIFFATSIDTASLLVYYRGSTLVKRR